MIKKEGADAPLAFQKNSKKRAGVFRIPASYERGTRVGACSYRAIGRSGTAGTFRSSQGHPFDGKEVLEALYATCISRFTLDPHQAQTNVGSPWLKPWAPSSLIQSRGHLEVRGLGGAQVQGYLAHKKTHPPLDHHRPLGIVLLYSPRRVHFFMSEILLCYNACSPFSYVGLKLVFTK